jgi:hypothetical protein
MPSEVKTPDRTKRSRTWLGLVALLVGYSVCLLPGFLAGGVPGDTLSWFGGASGWVVSGFALLAGVALFAYLRARLKHGAKGASFSCGGGCSCRPGQHP